MSWVFGGGGQEGAPNISILSSPNQAAKMAAEADIRRLLEEDPSPENAQILAVMFDPPEVDRIRKRVQEENDLLERMTAEALLPLQQQQQPAGGAESHSQEQTPKQSGGSVRSVEPSGSPTKKQQKERDVTTNSNGVIYIDTDTIQSNNQKEEEVELWKQKTAELEATVKQLRRELSDMKTQSTPNASTPTSHAVLQQEVDEWINMATAAEAKAQQANSELAEVTHQLEQANQTKEHLRQELEVTQQEVDTVTSTLVQYNQEWEEAAALQEELRKQIVHLETGMKARSSLLEHAQKRMEALEKDNEYLEQRVEQTKQQKKPFWQCG